MLPTSHHLCKAVRFVIATYMLHNCLAIAGDVTIKLHLTDDAVRRISYHKKDTKAKDESLNRLAEFVNNDTDGLLDAIVLVTPRRGILNSTYDFKMSPKRNAVVDAHGDWTPRIIVVNPNERIEVASERTGSVFQFNSSLDNDRKMLPRGIDNSGTILFMKGTTTVIGPFKEMKSPILFEDVVSSGPTYRSKNGFIFVTRSEFYSVTDAKGECIIGIPDECDEYGIEIWHEACGFNNDIEIAGRNINLKKEWIVIKKDLKKLDIIVKGIGVSE